MATNKTDAKSASKTKEKNRPWRTAGGIRIRPLKNRSGRYSYRVEVPEKVAGKRTLKQFKTAEEAEGYAATMEVQRMNNGLAAFTLTDGQRAMAKKAFEDLTSAGCDAAELNNAVTFYIAHHRPAGGEITFFGLVEKYLDEKRSGSWTKQGLKLRPRSLSDLESRLSMFNEEFGGRLVNRLPSSEAKPWLNDPTKSPQTRLNNFTVVNGLMRYAIAQKHLTINPLDGLRRPGVERDAPGIFTVAEAVRLLEAAQKRPDLEMGWYLVLGLFCGVRSSELERVPIENVRLDKREVSITQKEAKKRNIRHVPFVFTSAQTGLDEDIDPVSQWLDACPAPASGRIQPSSFSRKFKDLRTAAKIKSWPSNGLRPSFGSYSYELTANAPLVAARMGHKSDDLLFNHYRHLVSTGDGKRFFSIESPTAKNGKITKMPRKAVA